LLRRDELPTLPSRRFPAPFPARMPCAARAPRARGTSRRSRRRS